MREHLVIMRPKYIELALAGEKTIEARLMKRRLPPFGIVEPGDRLWLKPVGGEVAAHAVAINVEEIVDLTPDQIDILEKHYEPQVQGGWSFWDARRDAKYAAFVHLAGVKPVSRPPIFERSPGDRRGWIVLGRDEIRLPA